jgi:hypothetical protein
VVILPDSVELTGPKAILHTLSDSLPILISANGLDQNFEDDIEVTVPSTFVKRNPPQVNVMFEVGRVLQLNVNVKLAMSNQRTASLPDSVSCLLLVPEKRLEDFHRHKGEMRLRWEADQPKLINKPAFAELLKIDSVVKAQPL